MNSIFSTMQRNCCRYGLLSVAIAVGLMIALPVRAAETLTLRYGLLEASLPIADLHRYIQTGSVSTSLHDFLRFMSPEEQVGLRGFLSMKLPVNRVSLDRVLNSNTGVQLLSLLAGATAEGKYPGVQALRAAAVLGTKPDGLSVVDFLDAYPTRRLVVLIPKALQVAAESAPKPPDDRVSDTLLWQTWVEYQTTVGKDSSYQGCLFGDSISAALGDSLGPHTYNFAIGGMSTVSLVSQLQRLKANRVHCQKAIIAIGTNDAWYTIADERVSENLHQAIVLLRQLGATQISLLPAFYSTLAASKNPALAGPIPRVERINQVLNQVAQSESIPVNTAAIQPLFDGQTLKADLTTDGVHLNAAGLEIYRQALLHLFSATP